MRGKKRDNTSKELTRDVLYLYECYKKEVDLEVKYELQKEIMRLSFQYGVDIVKLGIKF